MGMDRKTKCFTEKTAQQSYIDLKVAYSRLKLLPSSSISTGSKFLLSLVKYETKDIATPTSTTRTSI